MTRVSNRRGLVAVAGTVVGVGGFVAERSLLRQKRRLDPEGAEPFGRRRGARPRTLELSDGARIFVEEVGPASSSGAVFVHGSALRTDAWHYQLSGIGTRRLVFYDLRGHGRSQPKGERPYSINTLAHDLERVIDDAELREVVVVGHSVGGMVALQYAVRNSNDLHGRVKGLVLLNTTYAPAVETLAGGAAIARLERLTRRPFDMIGSHSSRIEQLRRIIKPTDAIFWTVAFAAFGSGASASQVDFTYDMLAETPADVIVDLIKAYRDFDVRQLLGEIHVPVLVVGGTEDRITVYKASEHLAANLPNARLVTLEGCGHMSMVEKHAEVNELIDRFLAEVLDHGDEGLLCSSREGTDSLGT
jgi:pimeloyl-ACP methyl ester carboxylesterase